MFTKSSKKKSTGMCQVCTVVSIILGVVSVLATIAALIGVYKAHFLSTGLTFGTLNDSASLIALALFLFLTKKLSTGCPCQCEMKK
jgi:uncharacterized membrane protein YkgB